MRSSARTLEQLDAGAEGRDKLETARQTITAINSKLGGLWTLHETETALRDGTQKALAN